MTDDRVTEDRAGQVVTFYSYKGGTGRTMALANIAWILAANGKRVLVVDWDLESPGLHRYFGPFIEAGALESAGGVIDLIREYERMASETDHPDELPHDRYARVHRYSFTIDWPHFPGEGTLDFLSAGRQNIDYAANISGLNWDEFYGSFAGGRFFDALRDDMKRCYDYALIDSRTGFSDVADICTIHLPDVLVDCFTLNEQGIEGAARVARTLRYRAGRHPIRILPVPMRIDPAEKIKADRGREAAKQRFIGLPALPSAERDAYWSAVSVPYQAYYAYEETLATFADAPGTPNTLLSAYETLTGRITDGVVTTMPAMEESLRLRIHEQFVRQAAAPEEQIILRYEPEDTVWAEWIEHLLVSAGLRVADRSVDGPPTPASPLTKVLVIVSRLDPDGHLLLPPEERRDQPLAVYIGESTTLSPDVPVASSALVGLVADPGEAAERVLRLVGRPDLAGDVGTGGPRYPGAQPALFNAPARNARFTGREADLRNLRRQLRIDRSARPLSGTLPVALHGMAGIGKTQIAMEYAYRFRSAYDVVAWIDADASSDVDTALYELGKRLMPLPESVPEGVRLVLQALARGGEPFGRWLLIFDNAEEPERLADLMPKGQGHVLITSRDPLWGDRARAVTVDVFERAESIAHLVQRVTTMTPAEAEGVAEALGDLPIAIAAAAAWLAETGTSVADYLRQIEADDPRALSVEATRGQRVEATWDLALQRLQATSPAAYRLLQLCSVMAPELSLALIYSDAMAATLKPVDRSVADRDVRATLVQHISRLALLRMDQRGELRSGEDYLDQFQGGQVIVHRVLQLVVRSRMSEEEVGRARHQVHLMLAAARPSGDEEDPDQWPGYRALLPHLDVSGAARCSDEQVRQLLIDRVRYNFERGNSARGQELAEEYEKAWTEQAERTQDEVQQRALRQQILQLRFNLANVLRDQGRFEESLAMDDAVLRQQQELLGPRHPHTLMTAGSLAADLRGLGRYAEALAHDEQTYETTSDVFPEEHKRTLSALSNLAVSHRLMGDLRKAFEEDDRAYRLRRAVLGDSHPRTLLSATNAGRDLRELGDYNRSVELLASLVDRYVRVYGPGSRQVLNAQANLAVSLRNTGRTAEAAALLDRAYEELGAAVGPTHPDTLACRLSRAVTLFELNDVDRADAELRAVRDAYESSLGPEHPHTLVCTSNLAAFARRLGEPRSALELARTASEDMARRLGPDHPFTLAAQMNQAICAHDVGDARTALDLMVDAAGRLARVIGPEHPHTLRCQANAALIRATIPGVPAPTEEVAIIDRLAQRIGDRHGAVLALRDGKLLRRIIDPHPF
jgi:MinD-like ATPase involved in chromosome partitioning or flagellar assembly/tetratricopeptide (TPR) repeat protein